MSELSQVSWYVCIDFHGKARFKRYFDQGDIDAARESSLVDRVFGPGSMEEIEAQLFDYKKGANIG